MADTINQQTNIEPGLFDAAEVAYNRYINAPKSTMDGIYTRISTLKQKIVDHYVGDVNRNFVNDVGQATFSETRKATITIECEKKVAEDGIRIHREEELPENEAGYADRVRALYEAAVDLPNRLIAEAIEAGESNKAYDGVNYFSAATGKRKVTNLKANGSGTDLDKLAEDVGEVYGLFRQFRNEGHLVTARPNIILAPVSLEIPFRRLQIASATPEDNKNVGVPGIMQALPGFRLVVSDWLTDQNDWYMFDSNLNPMIWATWQQKDNDGVTYTDIRFIRDESAYPKQGYKDYSVSIWGKASYGHPFGAFKVKNS